MITVLKNHSHFNVWLGLVGLAITFRFITFFPLTIDMDESTYLVMTDHILNGGVLYKDVIDIKPPGIFLIFSVIQLLVGKSIFLIRLIAAIVVGSGGYFVYRTKRNWKSTHWASILSGAVFVFMFNFYFGFAVNTEIFFVFLTTTSIWVYSKIESGRKYYFFSGLLLGFSFLVKLHAAFDALALGLFILIVGVGLKKIGSTLLNSTLLTGGFLIPFMLSHLIFWMMGYYEYYHFITYEAPFNYSVERDSAVLLKYFKAGIITYLPFIIMAGVGFLAMQKRKDQKVEWLLLLMFILEWVAILATGKPHPHYWLQLSLPVALLAGSMYENEMVTSFFRKRLVKIVCVVLVSGYTIFLFKYYHKRYIQRSCHSENIYEYLKPLVKNEDKIYTGDGPQILYWLMDKTSPTAHIHQNHLTYPNKIATYKVNVKDEMEKIFASKAKFVTLSKNYPHDFVLERMDKEYELVNTIDGFNIYRIK